MKSNSCVYKIDVLKYVWALLTLGGAMMKIAVTIVHLLVSLFVIAVVLLQPAKVQGLSSTIAGGAETFFGKNKARTYEGKLQKMTTFAMILFVITSGLLIYYSGK